MVQGKDHGSLREGQGDAREQRAALSARSASPFTLNRRRARSVGASSDSLVAVGTEESEEGEWEEEERGEMVCREEAEEAGEHYDSDGQTGDAEHAMGNGVLQELCGEKDCYKDEEGRQKQHNQQQLEGKGSDIVAMFPPGALLVLSCDPPGCGLVPSSRGEKVPQQRQYGVFPGYREAKGVTWQLSRASVDDMRDIVVSPWCLSDHMPGFLLEGLYRMRLK